MRSQMQRDASSRHKIWMMRKLQRRMLRRGYKMKGHSLTRQNYFNQNSQKRDITVVEFRCNSGFKLRGRSSLRCVDGEWNGKVPTCVRESEQ